MSNLARQNSADDGNIVTSAIHQLLEISGIALPAKIVNNVVGGFLTSIDNKSAQHYARQKNITKTRQLFNKILDILKELDDPRARSSARFCNRVVKFADDKSLEEFMCGATSLYCSNPNRFLDVFSKADSHSIDKFVNNIDSYTLNLNRNR
jgi:hypothetical protein